MSPPVTRRQRALWKLRDVGTSARYAAARDRIPYVGWVGFGNIGDEAMLAGYRRVLPVGQVTPVPSPDLIRLLPRQALAFALGGGTLIGWPIFRQRIEALARLHAEIPLVMLGTGVEDPNFAAQDKVLRWVLRKEHGEGDTATLLRRELERWAPTFARARGVLVRGERSRELLGEAGISAEAVGDPALLLADPFPSGSVDGRLLGLNVGIAHGVWGGTPTELLDELVALGRRWSTNGRRVRFVATTREDRAVARDAASRVGKSAETAEPKTPADALAAIRPCVAFVGMKLHSIVLASAVHVPSVAIEYHPKCAEFQASIGRAEFAMRSDALDAGVLDDVLDRLVRDRDTHVAEVARGVAATRSGLERHAAALCAALRDEGS